MRMDRKGFVAMTGSASLAAFLAACGGGDEAKSDVAASTAAPVAPTFDPSAEADGPIQFLTWAGYDDDASSGSPWIWSEYQDGPYGKKSPLDFSFLENDAQALAKVASGYAPDVVHPCINWLLQWHNAGLIQPLDTSLLPDFGGVPEEFTAGGTFDGLPYFMPFDVGFSSLVYDADVVDFDQVGGQETYRILLDERYKGKMSFFSDPVGIILTSFQMNEGNIDPYVISTEQIAAAKETALKWKPNMRNYWSASNDAVEDFVNGNVVVTYAWPYGYWQIKNHPKMKGRNIKYMQPVEGRGVWVCGMVLTQTAKRPGRAMLAMASANRPQAAADLTDFYQYAAAQQQGVDALIKNRELIEIFQLDQPDAWKPPLAWPDRPLPNQREVQVAGEEVKSA